MNYKEAALFFEKHLDMVPSQTKIDFNDKSLQLREGSVYVRTIVPNSAGSIYDLIKSSTKKQIGISSIDGTKLEDSENLIVTKLRLAYAFDASATIGLIRHSVKAENNAVPIMNSELVITSDGSEVFRQPASSFFLNAEPTETGQNYTELKRPFLLKEGADLRFQLHFPEGVALSGADNHHLEVSLGGFITKRR